MVWNIIGIVLKKDYRNREFDCLFQKLFTMPTNFLNDVIEIIEDTPKEDKKIEKIKKLDFENLRKFINTFADNSFLNDNEKKVLKDFCLETRTKINKIIEVLNKE